MTTSLVTGGSGFLGSHLCERLLAMGAPGLHFFSLNDGERVAKIWHALGLPQPLGAPGALRPHSDALQA